MLSRSTENDITIDDYVVIENVPDEIIDECTDHVDGNIVKRLQSEYFTENKIESNTFHNLSTPKENHLQYVQFNNEYEVNNDFNGKTNSDYYSESSSETSSNNSISFRRIVLTPIKENEIKLSNGYN